MFLLGLKLFSKIFGKFQTHTVFFFEHVGTQTWVFPIYSGESECFPPTPHLKFPDFSSSVIPGSIFRLQKHVPMLIRTQW